MNSPETTDQHFEFPIGDELDLHTFQAREVKSVVEEYLYQCHMLGLTEVRIIHGKGIGTLRRIVRQVLEKSPNVLSFSEAPSQLGGWGATVVQVRRKGE